jgi:hypothetical protein
VIPIFVPFPTCSSSKNQDSINKCWREEWGLAGGVPMKLKTMSLLILAPENVNNFPREGMQVEVLTMQFRLQAEGQKTKLAKCTHIRLNAQCSTGQTPKNPLILPSALTSA